MPRDRFVAETIASNPDLALALRTSGIEEPGITRVLHLLNEMPAMALVVLLAKSTGRGGAGAAANPVMREGLEELVRRVAERHGFREEEVREALVLLRNGTFERDLASVAAETSRAVGQMPSAVARSVQGALINPLRVLGFAFAVARDLAELPVEGGGLSHREFERLMRGGAASPGRNYPLFDHTFAALYEIEPIDA